MKRTAGYRIFRCGNDECEHEGVKQRMASRDCFSSSSETCPYCADFMYPEDYEEHPEWSREFIEKNCD